MTIELTILAWTLVLALIQISLPGMLRTQETGADYNVGPRDDPGPPKRPITGRMQRAQANLFETLPLFIAAVLIAHVAGRDGTLTLWGCWMYLIARIIYVPLYAFGIPVARTLTWLVATAGLVLVLIAVLSGA